MSSWPRDKHSIVFKGFWVFDPQFPLTNISLWARNCQEEDAASWSWSVVQSLIVSDCLQPHGLWHARLPCSSPSPGVCTNLCPLSQTLELIQGSTELTEHLGKWLGHREGYKNRYYKILPSAVTVSDRKCYILCMERWGTGWVQCFKFPNWGQWTTREVSMRVEFFWLHS